MDKGGASHEVRIAVVSGGTGYVGSAIVRKLAEDGLRVAILYHRATEESVREILASLPGTGHEAYQSDITDTKSVARAIQAIEERQGPLYASIHAAGVMPMRKQLHLSSVQNLREQFEPNVFGSFNFLSTCALRLKEHGRGVIVGITTAGVATDTNTKARGAYSPMKFALQGMLVSFREELAPYHVRVYSVAPGVMPGGMNKDTPQAFLDMVKESSPTKTLAGAADVADIVSFLCSDKSVDLSDLTILIAPESAGT